MTFRITGLDPAPFRPLFDLDDEALAACGVVRVTADADFGFPDRVGLCDARAGETLLLLNYEHQPAPPPYRSRHAIFVREGAAEPFDAIALIPPALRSRALSLRSFTAGGEMLDADLVDGREAEALIERLLADPRAAYVHAHYAKRGCYAALIRRA